MFRQIGKSSDLAASDAIKDEAVEDAVMHVLSGVVKTIDKDYADAYLAPLFKNVKKCTDIRSKLEKP
jgi:ribosome-binding factor A